MIEVNLNRATKSPVPKSIRLKYRAVSPKSDELFQQHHPPTHNFFIGFKTIEINSCGNWLATSRSTIPGYALIACGQFFLKQGLDQTPAHIKDLQHGRARLGQREADAGSGVERVGMILTQFGDHLQWQNTIINAGHSAEGNNDQVINAGLNQGAGAFIGSHKLQLNLAQFCEVVQYIHRVADPGVCGLGCVFEDFPAGAAVIGKANIPVSALGVAPMLLEYHFQ